MNKTMRLAVLLWLLLMGALASQAGATTYSLWIKGRGTDGVPGNYNDFSYWGPASYNAGVNKKAVRGDPLNFARRRRNALGARQGKPDSPQRPAASSRQYANANVR